METISREVLVPPDFPEEALAQLNEQLAKVQRVLTLWAVVGAPGELSV